MGVKKLVSKSVDFRYFLSGLLWFGISMVIFLTLAIVLSSTDSAGALRMAATFLLIFLIPVTLYYAIRIILLFVDSKDSYIYTADVLEVHDEHFALFRSCSFTLTIPKDDGSAFTSETSSVFKTTDFSSTYFGNYVNKTLQVLYNPKSETVIVVGELNSERST